ncbi:alpha-L-rhamnosidase [Sporothrix brasiliensis 5110]|uniref:alpha-L-rhamnosidase n=1 Tax=Sporothrix brasiliensis 5110 TaxID=1398154 RepID=A0A0C2J8F9_9PEZI|nr:alpha-L-rhamnosidase [Sporothrix brasiliensis 5110]KIH93282.1 alpha-L-rhamnosidase [Sporothrix brasiliensis 5110]
MPSIRISSLTFEHHATGFGIGHAKPRISWRFDNDGDVKNWVQESYEIQLTGQDPTQRPDTLTIRSADSVLVPWPWRALASRESVQVQVRTHGVSTDDSGNSTTVSTEWSSPVTIETALLDNADWKAKLTASSFQPPERETLRPMLFRKSFSLPGDAGPISQARLYITAHGVYKAYLNGQQIGNEEMAPGWTNYKSRLLFSTFDVTQQLRMAKNGSNVLGVEVAEGWFAGRLAWADQRWVYGNRIAFLAQLEVRFDDGSQLYTLTSDNTWTCRHSATVRSEIYDGEDYDAREDEKITGWDSDPSFDEGGAWMETEELAFPSAQLVSSDTPPVRATETISPLKIFKSPSGKTLVDFGQNLVGKLQVRLPAADKDGHIIKFTHAEVLEHDELGTRPLRTAKALDRVFLSQQTHTQPSTWSPKFTFHGFRYVQVDGWPTPDGMPAVGDLAGLVLHSDMKRTGWFSCSEPLINKLHENVVWSMKGNFFSIPTDCPQRDERLGWTGDIQVFSPSANFIYDTRGFLGSWLEDVLAEQLRDNNPGYPGLVVPDVLGDDLGAQSVWHDVTVLTPWDLYNSSGDVEILRKQYPSMKIWVDKGIPRGDNGLWDQNAWQFGDWLDPAAPPDDAAAGRTDVIIVADCYLVRVLEAISKISSLLGETEDAHRYSEDAARTKAAFGREYIASSGLLVGDTQTAYALALRFGLFDSTEKVERAAERLCHLIQAAKYRIATGFAGTPVITHALSGTGNHQMAYRMLLEQSCPSWLYPVTMGATTIWERWDSMLPDGTINPGEMTSFNHYALGSVANWLHECVGGIASRTPGWRSIKVKPLPGGTITNADVAYESPYGRIACSWNVNEAKDTFNMTLVVPPNARALVVLPSEWQAASQEPGDEKGIAVGRLASTANI